MNYLPIDIFIIGTGGFAREVVELIEDINEHISFNPPIKSSFFGYGHTWNILGYLDSDSTRWGTKVNGYEVLGDESVLDEYLQKSEGIYPHVAIGIGSPQIKRKIVEKLNGKVFFPNLAHPTATIGRHETTFGVGNIITAGCVITCNVSIGNHVMINLNCTVGHDAVIQDYTVMSPGVNLSGNTVIEEGCYIGNGASILEKKTIGAWSIVGGLALVNSDLPKNTTSVGVPAKVIKTRDDGWHL